MGLIDLQTNLKSLKYGKDRFGGGDSGQPFIKNPIIDEPSQLTHADDDFLLRGGVQAPLRAAEDVARLTKYLFNPKSPSGLLFTAKQNLLSRTAVKTEASYGAAYAGGTLNEGVYTPLSTLAQAGVGFLGIHLNKQGIDPTGLIPGLSIRNYSTLIQTQIFTDNLKIRSIENSTNRLIGFLERKQNQTNTSPNLLTYGGGPGSKLGIGKTRIKFADQRTGVNNSNYKKNFYYKKPREVEYKFNKIFLGDSVQFSMDNTYIKGSVSMLYAGKTGISSNELIGGDSNFNFIDNPFLPSDSNNVYESFPKMAKDSKGTPIIGNGLWTQEEFIQQPKTINNEILDDFRKKPLSKNLNSQNTFLSISPNYKDKNIEKRVNLGDPGQKGDRSDYTIGKFSSTLNDFTPLGPLDKITALPIYKSTNVTGKDVKNDLCKFRIAVIDPNSPNEKFYMHFRAFINKFSDGYKSNWKGQKYMGRAEELYKYGGFNRDISIDFTIAAQSKEELIPMYKKLNFLASTLAPTYTQAGYMAGNISQITLGGYLYEQPGIIESVNFDIPTESPWEIGIPSKGVEGKSFYDSTVKELPHIINVSISFTPIHRFRPSINKMESGNNGGAAEDSVIDNNVYGKEKYIALKASGDSDSYNNKGGNTIDRTNNKIKPSPPSQPLPPAELVIVEKDPNILTSAQLNALGNFS
jgi:hypothetical protein